MIPFMMFMLTYPRNTHTRKDVNQMLNIPCQIPKIEFQVISKFSFLIFCIL